MAALPNLTHEALYGALKLMVLATDEFSRREEMQKAKSHMNEVAWSKEFRTVRYQVGAIWSPFYSKKLW